MTIVKALIFDLDGTMADTEETHRQAFNAAFLEHALWWDWSREQYQGLLRISGGKERIAVYIDSLKATTEEKARLLGLVPMIHGTKTRVFGELIADGRAALRTGVARLIREARDAGIKLGIASTTSPENVSALLRAQLGAESYRFFDAIACGDLVAHKKPAPDIYTLALAMLGLGAGECVAFEDSVNGLAAAKAAGLYTVVTPNFWSMADDFTDADLLLQDLGDPGQPFDERTAKIVGAPWLGLAQLEQLHAAALQRHAAA
jgi:HAD superfamily hydrolase (TIGR01509 family)